MRAHKSHKITPAEFLYFSNSRCEYMRQGTLFIGMGALVGKMGKGKMDKGRGVAKGVDHGQNRIFRHIF